MLLAGLCIIGCAVAAAVLVVVQQPVGARPSYALASKEPSPGSWNCMAEWPEMTLEELCSMSHSVVWVEITGVAERWTWNGVQWSRYNAHVHRYITAKAGLTPASLEIIQLGGDKEVYYNYPQLTPGRSYILVLQSYEAGGRYCPNYVLHPLSVYPLVAQDVVEVWWPGPPWDNPSPFRNVSDLIQEIAAYGD